MSLYVCNLLGSGGEMGLMLPGTFPLVYEPRSQDTILTSLAPPSFLFFKCHCCFDDCVVSTELSSLHVHEALTHKSSSPRSPKSNTNKAVVWNVRRVHSCCWVYSLAKLVFMVSPLKQLWSSRFLCTWQGGRHALAACRSKSNGLCFPKVLTQSIGSC